MEERGHDVDDLVVDVLAFASSGLSFTARGLLSHLMGSGTARHSVDQLVDDSGTPRGEVLRAARELEEAGLVRLGRAEDPTPGLASVTSLVDDVDEQPVTVDREAAPPVVDRDQAAVTLAGVNAARAAIAAARAAGHQSPATRHEHRPYLPAGARVPRPSRELGEPDCEHDK